MFAEKHGLTLKAAELILFANGPSRVPVTPQRRPSSPLWQHDDLNSGPVVCQSKPRLNQALRTSPTSASLRGDAVCSGVRSGEQ